MGASAGIMINAIIFDLDSCLSAADEVGSQFFGPAFTAVRRENAGAISEAELLKAFGECWRFPFDDVSNRFGFTESMREAGFRSFAELAVTAPMYGYGDLDVLKELPARLFLVTTGFRRLQESKIAALGIAPIFEEICIDAIDEPNPRGKAAIFAELAARRGLHADRTIVVGDNPDSEIAAGNGLGMTTVQILRPGVTPGSNAAHTITGLAELKGVIQSLHR